MLENSTNADWLDLLHKITRCAGLNFAPNNGGSKKPSLLQFHVSLKLLILLTSNNNFYTKMKASEYSCNLAKINRIEGFFRSFP